MAELVDASDLKSDNRKVVWVRFPPEALSQMNNLRAVTALTIWWCEGTKARKDPRWKTAMLSPVEVINTDPRVIKIFLTFITEDLGLELSKVKGQLQIHEGDNKQELEQFWSKATGVPLSQFNKTIIRPTGNKIAKNRGTFKIRTYNKTLYNNLHKMLNENFDRILIPGNSSDG